MKRCFKISKDLNVFAIKEKGEHTFYCVDEIVCIKSEEDYFRIYHPKPSCLIKGALKKISINLPNHFIISHKSYTVNIKRVRKWFIIVKKIRLMSAFTS